MVSADAPESRKVVLWDGVEQLSNEEIYVVAEADRPLFKELADRQIRWVSYSERLPGGSTAALVYVSVIEDARIDREAVEAYSIRACFDEFVESANYFDSQRLARACLRIEREGVTARLQLRNAAHVAEAVRSVVNNLDSLWYECLLSGWRPLEERTIHNWRPGQEWTERIQDLLEALSRLHESGVGVWRIRETIRELNNILKRWDSLEVEQVWFFVAIYMYVQAAINIERQRWNLGVIYSHRALEAVYIAYGLELALIEPRERLNRFVFSKREDTEVSVVRLARAIFEPGSANVRSARQVNDARNRLTMTHGVDDASEEEARKSLSFVERCLDRLGDGKIPRNMRLSGAWWWWLKRGVLYECEADYDVFFRWEAETLS